MRYLYTPHLNLIHEISLHTTPEKKILNNTILMLTTLLIRKYQLLISETTEQKSKLPDSRPLRKPLLL